MGEKGNAMTTNLAFFSHRLLGSLLSMYVSQMCSKVRTSSTLIFAAISKSGLFFVTMTPFFQYPSISYPCPYPVFGIQFSPMVFYPFAYLGISSHFRVNTL